MHSGVVLKEDSATATSLAPQASAAETGEGITPKVWQIAVTALIAIAFTAVWLGLYDLMNKVIWESDFVAQNRWTLPFLVLFFSLLVGLAQKYLGAPNVIHGGAAESITGEDEKPSARIPLLGTLLSSYGSLLSGASIGPEGALAFLILQISTWLHSRLRASKESAPGFVMAAMASAYNGIIGSALFSGVLATELRVGGIGQREGSVRRSGGHIDHAVPIAFRGPIRGAGPDPPAARRARTAPPQALYRGFPHDGRCSRVHRTLRLSAR